MLYHPVPTLMSLGKKHFENIVGKGENVGKQQFLVFLQCFLSFLKQFSILVTSILSSASAFKLD